MGHLLLAIDFIFNREKQMLPLLSVVWNDLSIVKLQPYTSDAAVEVWEWKANSFHT